MLQPSLATILFVIGVPSLPPSARARRPDYVSPSTQSLTIANGSGTVIAQANLTPQSAGCTLPTASTPLTCTVSATIPAGTATYTVTTYDRPGATGTKLAVAALSITGSAGSATTVNLTLSGIVASLTIALDPASLPSGTAKTAALIVNALDPAGNIIVGPQGYVDASGNPLTIALADSDLSGATTLGQPTITTPAGDIAVHYSGASLASATITASASGVTSKNATLTIGTASALITEFRTGISPQAFFASSGTIAVGADGNLWFTEPSGDRIGRITPHGVVREFSAGITPFSAPAGIAAGPDGNLWFTENGAFAGGGGRIGRITPSGVITEFSNGMPSGAQPASIALGADGNLWFTDTVNPRIGRITTAGVVTIFTTGVTRTNASNISSCGMALGPNGNIWWTDFDQALNGGANGGSAAILQITTSGAATEYNLNKSSAGGGVAAGPDGNVWFDSSGAIGRITPTGTITNFSTGLAGFPFGCMTLGPDGNVWFTEEFNDAVGRITPSGTITEFSAGITSTSEPNGITSGPDGNLWFTESGIAGIGRVNLR